MATLFVLLLESKEIDYRFCIISGQTFSFVVSQTKKWKIRLEFNFSGIHFQRLRNGLLVY